MLAAHRLVKAQSVPVRARETLVPGAFHTAVAQCADTQRALAALCSESLYNRLLQPHRLRDVLSAAQPVTPAEEPRQASVLPCDALAAVTHVTERRREADAAFRRPKPPGVPSPAMLAQLRRDLRAFGVDAALLRALEQFISEDRAGQQREAVDEGLPTTGTTVDDPHAIDAGLAAGVSSLVARGLADHSAPALLASALVGALRVWCTNADEAPAAGLLAPCVGGQHGGADATATHGVDASPLLKGLELPHLTELTLQHWMATDSSARTQRLLDLGGGDEGGEGRQGPPYLSLRTNAASDSAGSAAADNEGRDTTEDVFQSATPFVALPEFGPLLAPFTLECTVRLAAPGPAGAAGTDGGEDEEEEGADDEGGQDDRETGLQAGDRTLLCMSTVTDDSVEAWFGVTGDGRLQLRMAQNVEFSTTHRQLDTHDGQWRHVAVACSGDTAMFFVDGIMVQSVQREAPQHRLQSPCKLVIGACPPAGARCKPLNGDLACVRVWSEPLSPAELARRVPRSAVPGPSGTAEGAGPLRGGERAREEEPPATPLRLCLRCHEGSGRDLRCAATDVLASAFGRAQWMREEAMSTQEPGMVADEWSLDDDKPPTEAMSTDSAADEHATNPEAAAAPAGRFSVAALLAQPPFGQLLSPLRRATSLPVASLASLACAEQLAAEFLLCRSMPALNVAGWSALGMADSRGVRPHVLTFLLLHALLEVAGSLLEDSLRHCAAPPASDTGDMAECYVARAHFAVGLALGTLRTLHANLVALADTGVAPGSVGLAVHATERVGKPFGCRVRDQLLHFALLADAATADAAALQPAVFAELAAVRGAAMHALVDSLRTLFPGRSERVALFQRLLTALPAQAGRTPAHAALSVLATRLAADPMLRLPLVPHSQRVDWAGLALQGNITAAARFDASVLTAGMSLSPSGTRVSCAGDGPKYKLAVAGVGVGRGTHMWEFRVDQELDGEEYTLFGVCTTHAPAQLDFRRSNHLFLYGAYSGNVFAAGKVVSKRNPKLHTGDVIRITYDGTAHSLAFAVNGRSLGVLCRDVRPDAAAGFVYPAVLMYHTTGPLRAASITRMVSHGENTLRHKAVAADEAAAEAEAEEVAAEEAGVGGAHGTEAVRRGGVEEMNSRELLRQLRLLAPAEWLRAHGLDASERHLLSTLSQPQLLSLHNKLAAGGVEVRATATTAASVPGGPSPAPANPLQVLLAVRDHATQAAAAAAAASASHGMDPCELDALPSVALMRQLQADLVNWPASGLSARSVASRAPVVARLRGALAEASEQSKFRNRSHSFSRSPASADRAAASAPLLFDTARTGPGLSVSEQGRAITSARTGWATALAAVAFPRRTGKYRWQVLVRSVTATGQLLIGVACKRAALDRHLGADAQSCALYAQTRGVYLNGEASASQRGPALRAGMQLVVEVDTDTGTLAFSDAAGQDAPRVARTDLGRFSEFIPAIAMGDAQQCVVFVGSVEHTPRQQAAEEASAAEHAAEVVPDSLHAATESYVPPPARPPSQLLLSYLHESLRGAAAAFRASEGEHGPERMASWHVWATSLAPLLALLATWPELALRAGPACAAQLEALITTLDTTVDAAEARAAADGGSSAASTLAALLLQAQVLAASAGGAVAAQLIRASPKALEWWEPGPAAEPERGGGRATAPAAVAAVAADAAAASAAREANSLPAPDTSEWCSSPLLAGGPRNDGKGAWHALLREREGVRAPQTAGPGTRTAGAARIPRLGLADASEELLLEIVRHTGQGAGLDAWVSRHVGGVLQNVGGAALATAVRWVIAALLHHSDTVQSALAAAAARPPATSKPPERLMAVWSAAIRVKEWAIRQQADTGTSMEAIAGSVVNKAHFLLDMSSAFAALRDDTGELMVSAPSPLPATPLVMGPSMTPTPTVQAAQWRSIGSVVRAVQRWRAGTAEGERMRALEAVSALAEAGRQFFCADLTLPQLQQAVRVCQRRARLRIAGLRLATRLLAAFTLERDQAPAKAALAMRLGAALSTVGGVDATGVVAPVAGGLDGEARGAGKAPWTYAEGLEPVGGRLLLEVKQAFDQLYGALIRELEAACTTGDVFLCLPTLVSWGLSIRPIDHAMLASTRVFRVLQSLLAASRTNAVEGELLHQAAIKAVVLLASQVAAAPPEVVADDPANVQAGQAALPRHMTLGHAVAPRGLRHMRSGPDALEDAVFDMLFEELTDAMDAVNGAGARRDGELLVGLLPLDTSLPGAEGEQDPLSARRAAQLIDELTLLLSAVSTTTVCSQHLMHDHWISLMLRLATQPPGAAPAASLGEGRGQEKVAEPQDVTASRVRRGMRLLRRTLPLTDPDRLHVTLPFLSPRELDAPGLLQLLFDCIAVSCAPRPHRAFPDLALPALELSDTRASEAVALLRSLLNLRSASGPGADGGAGDTAADLEMRWGELCHRELRNQLCAFPEAVMRRHSAADDAAPSDVSVFSLDWARQAGRAAAALAVMGGHFEALRVGGCVDVTENGEAGDHVSGPALAMSIAHRTNKMEVVPLTAPAVDERSLSAASQSVDARSYHGTAASIAAAAAAGAALGAGGAPAAAEPAPVEISADDAVPVPSVLLRPDAVADDLYEELLLRLPDLLALYSEAVQHSFHQVLPVAPPGPAPEGDTLRITALAPDAAVVLELPADARVDRLARDAAQRLATRVDGPLEVHQGTGWGKPLPPHATLEAAGLRDGAHVIVCPADVKPGDLAAFVSAVAVRVLKAAFEAASTRPQLLERLQRRPDDCCRMMRFLLGEATQETSGYGLSNLSTFEEIIGQLWLRMQSMAKERHEAGNRTPAVPPPPTSSAVAPVATTPPVMAAAAAAAAQQISLVLADEGPSEAAVAAAPAAAAAAGGTAGMLAEMGFPLHWCEKALARNGGEFEAALNYILNYGDVLQGEDEEGALGSTHDASSDRADTDVFESPQGDAESDTGFSEQAADFTSTADGGRFSEWRDAWHVAEEGGTLELAFEVAATGTFHVALASSAAPDSVVYELVMGLHGGQVVAIRRSATGWPECGHCSVVAPDALHAREYRRVRVVCAEGRVVAQWGEAEEQTLTLTDPQALPVSWVSFSSGNLGSVRVRNVQVARVPGSAAAPDWGNDQLEQDRGEAFYAPELRFFGHRQAATTAEATADHLHEVLNNARRAARTAAFAPAGSRTAFQHALVQTMDGPTCSARMVGLCVQTVALTARRLLLAFTLHAAAPSGAPGGPRGFGVHWFLPPSAATDEGATVDVFPARVSATRHTSASLVRMLVTWLRLVTHYVWSPPWLRANLPTGPADTAPDSVPLGSDSGMGVTVHDLLTPIMLATLLGECQAAGSVPHSLQLGAAAVRTCADMLLRARHPEHAGRTWTDEEAMQRRDPDALVLPDLPFITWVTDVLVQALRVVTDAAQQVGEGGNGARPLRSALWTLMCALADAWGGALRSPSMALKERACRAFVRMLAEASRARAAGGDVDLRRLVRQVPIARLRRLAERRLGKEMEDAPLYSKYVQRLVEMVTWLQLLGVDSAAAPPAALPAAPPRHMLWFHGGASHVSLASTDVGGSSRPSYRNAMPPWTLELWVWRAGARTRQFISMLGTAAGVPCPDGGAAVSSATGVTRTLFADGVIRADRSETATCQALLSSTQAVIALTAARSTGRPNCVGLCLPNAGRDYAWPLEVPCQEWTHLAFVATPQLLVLYANGSRVGAVPEAVSLPTDMLGGQGNSFSGALHEVRLWSTALTPDWLRRNKDRAVLVPDQDPNALAPAALFPLDEGQGTFVRDLVGEFPDCLATGTEWRPNPNPPTVPHPLASSTGASAAETAADLAPVCIGARGAAGVAAATVGGLHLPDADAPLRAVGSWRCEPAAQLGGMWVASRVEPVELQYWRAGAATSTAASALSPGEEARSGTSVPVEGRLRFARSCVSVKVSGRAWAPGSRTEAGERARECNMLLLVEDWLDMSARDCPWLIGATLRCTVQADGVVRGSWSSTCTIPASAMPTRPDMTFALAPPPLSASWRSELLAVEGGSEGEGARVIGVQPGANAGTSVAHALLAFTTGEQAGAAGAAAAPRRWTGPGSRPPAFSRGRWLWEVRVARLGPTGAVGVGVVLTSAVDFAYESSSATWLYYSNGTKWNDRRTGNYGPEFGANDVIGVELDADAGALRFYKNGADAGMAFVGMKDQVTQDEQATGFIPMVALCGEGSRLEALGLKHGPGQVAYHKADARGRQRFVGNWRLGQRSGVGQLTIGEAGSGGTTTASSVGVWLGEWAEDYPVGWHVRTPLGGGHAEEGGAASEGAPARAPTSPPAPDARSVHLWVAGQYERQATEEEAQDVLQQLRPRWRAQLEAMRSGGHVPPEAQVPTEAVRAGHTARLHTGDGPGSAVEVIGSLSTSPARAFVMSEAGPCVQLSEDLLSAEHTGPNERTLVLGSRGFRSGVHYWEVKVQACDWGSLFIGVAERKSGMASGLRSWRNYGLISYRCAYDSGMGERLYGTFFGAGDTIGVLLDMDHGRLSFIKDGEDFMLCRVVAIDMGVACRYVRGGGHGGRGGRAPTLYPAFGLSKRGDKLALVEGKALSLPGVTARALLSRAVDTAALLRSWTSGLPRSFLRRAHRTFQRWAAGRVLHPCRVAGQLAEVDASPAACARVLLGVPALAGLRAGTVVGSPRGDVRVLGANQLGLWFASDNEPTGAWFWTPAELRAMLASNGFTIKDVPPPSPGLSADAAAAAADTSAAQLSLTFEEYCAALQRATLPKLDERLALVVDAACDHHSVEPEQVTVEQLCAHLRSVVEASATVDKPLAAVLACPAAEAQLRGPDTPPGLVAIMARFCALLELNRMAGELLPLVDMSLGLRPLMRVDENDSRDAGLRYLSLTGRLLALHRSLLFSRTKLAHWRAVIRATTTPTTPPQDEYEKPRDIPTLHLNRVRAAAVGRNHDSGRHSLFAQLFRNIGSWADAQLRRAYTDVQDAGQERAFFVSLEGESAVDHGGPYRTVVETSASTDVLEPMRLLVPCPNASLPNAVNRDKYVLNACRRSHSALAHYGFFGKLLGLAVRHRIMLPLNLPALFWRPLVGRPVRRRDLNAVDTSLVSQLRQASSLPDDVEGVMDAEDLLTLYQHLLASVPGASASSVASEFVVEAERVYRLLPDGSRVAVDAAQRLRIAQEAELLHTTATSRQLAATYRGMSAVLPVELFSMFTEVQLEELVCGKPSVDLRVLKKATEYDGVSATDPHIRIFWEVLEDFSQEERMEFVNFVCARSRLPTSADKFPMSFRITRSAATAQERPDEHLPTSQTCFFTLSLPPYTSKDVCKRKLLFALRHAPNMDGDFVARSAAGWEDV